MDRTILLVEDDPSLAAVLQRILRRLDARVEHVAHGREALCRIARNDLDLVVLDLDLPDLDGTEVCRAARVGGYSGPILVLTARHGEEPRDESLVAGADDFLTKPFSVAELMSRLSVLLSKDTGFGRSRAV